MAKSLAALYAQAESDFAGGRWEEALRGYTAVMKGAPLYNPARYRVADTLLNLGDRQRAKEVYRSLAWFFIKVGQPLVGLVVAKMLLALEPAYDDVLEILAELYGADSDRLGDQDIERPPALSEAANQEEPAAVPLAALVEEAVKLATDTDEIMVVPPRFPAIPLFSHLPHDAFIKVLGSLKLKRAAHGERIISEGEPGDAFYMVADGRVVISKRVDGKDAVMANLKSGAVFGEMALVSRAPRTATVTAHGEVALLALFRSDLESESKHLESVTAALRKFTRGRFLANLCATSPLFMDLPKAERPILLKRFQARMVNPGDILIEQGEAGRGLYLIMKGEADVAVRGADGKEKQVARLKAGDVFGEMSLLRDAPTTATVTVATPTEILYLAKEDFDAMLDAHPEVEKRLMRISVDRFRMNRFGPAAMTGEVATDDEKVMI